MNKNIRNVAIIAHVDHGKTTLVDGMLRQSGVFRSNETLVDCVMDSNALERERGITILAKNTAVTYRGIKINIVDTPGHADFSGEVERVLGMVDGCLLIVDAFEGPMPQTRFVLRKALEQGLKPIVVVNKIDRPGSRPLEVQDLVLDLFIDLGADDDQIEFPTLYASGLHAYARASLDDRDKDLRPLFEAMLRHVPPPAGDEQKTLQMQVTTLDYDNYLGRVVIGRIHNGVIKQGQPVTLLQADGGRSPWRVSKLFTFDGLQRVEIQEAGAGDIVAVAGVEDATMGETISAGENPVALPMIRVDEPTMEMTFSVNDSPFAGKEGKYVTSRHLRERLTKELETNMSLRVETTDRPGDFLVSGRGELHLGILIETMRREGYEFSVSKPRVIFKEVEGKRYEPYELLVLDVPDENVGPCMEGMGSRKGDLQNMQADGNGRTMIEFLIPARGLIGFRSEFIRFTKGYGVMNHSFYDYQPYAGDIIRQRNGVLIAWEEGPATSYAILNLADRGAFFIAPGTQVYGGMIVGENNRASDLPVNVCKTKKLTNMRAAGGEELVRLTTPVDMNLERALEYIEDDELVEVTPLSVRLRKRALLRK